MPLSLCLKTPPRLVEKLEIDGPVASSSHGLIRYMPPSEIKKALDSLQHGFL